MKSHIYNRPNRTYLGLFAQMAVAFAATLLVFTLAVSFNGCATSQQPPTREAIVYYSFADTWTGARAAYGAYCELVVKGKVSKADEQEVDAAWNHFRNGFKLSFKAASNNWNAATPDEVQKLRDELISLINLL